MSEAPDFNDLFNRTQASSPRPVGPPPEPTDLNQRRAWGIINSTCNNLASLPEGSRQTESYETSWRLFCLALWAGLDTDAVTDQIFHAFELNGEVGDSGERKMRDTLARALREAEPLPPDDRPNPNGLSDTTSRAEQPAGDDSGGYDKPPRYTDFAALLAGGLPDPPRPAFLHRTDDVAIFYRGKRNEIYGDPEDGKTMIALAAAAEHLAADGTVLFLDLDNNGAVETAQRMQMLGAPTDAITDPQRFRHIEPDDADELCRVVADCAAWAGLVVIDCVGELLPLFSGSSDSADDYTRIMQMVSAPLERGGAAVLLIDHQAKGRDSRAYGAGGTMAKRRAISGVSINAVRRRTFTPGQGGAAELWINKDRPGGLRQHCTSGESRRQFAGTFILDADNTGWRVTTDRVEPAAAIDPVVERHYNAAVALSDTATGATVATVAAAANGLPAGTPPTRAQKETSRRSLEAVTRAGRLVLVAGASPQRWEVAA